MTNQHLHVALASDKNYAKFVSILIVSLFDNNPDFKDITVHLLSNGIDDETLNEIKKHIPQNRGYLEVYDISDIQKRLGVSVPPTISISSYSRLFLGTLVSNDIDKILYLDTDAIVNGSFFELWNLELAAYHVAGVLDDVSLYAKSAIGLKPDSIYLNAGFLLINLALWRQEGMERKILDYLLAHNGKVYHHDQGLINAVCNKKYVLPVNYNMVTNFFVFPYSSFKQTPFYTEEEMEDGKKNPVFIHFTAGVANRPWMENCKHPLKQIFLKYKSLSSYKNEPLAKDNRPAKLKLLAFLYYNIRPLYYLALRIRDGVKK